MHPQTEDEYVTTYFPRATDVAAAAAIDVAPGAQLRNIDIPAGEDAHRDRDGAGGQRGPPARELELTDPAGVHQCDALGAQRDDGRRRLHSGLGSDPAGHLRVPRRDAGIVLRDGAR